MADAAIGFARNGHDVWFVTVAPTKEFFSAPGRETLLQLLSQEKSSMNIVSVEAGYEFEFGTLEYRTWVYRSLLVKLPDGIPVVVSDDSAVWEAATSLCDVHPVVGVLHADEDQYYRLAERYYKKVAVFACVSNRINRIVTQKIPGFDPAHIFTIPCGIKLPPADKYEVHGGVLQLVYVGRVSHYQKRAGDQAKVCALLKEKGIPFHLSVIGDGDAKASLSEVLIEGGLQHYVTFYGWLTQKEVAIHLSESDILLLTSDFEGTPIAMMEALATGCGMVGTRVSGIEDYEHHPLAKDCLGVYTVGNIDEAVEKIVQVSGIPGRIRREAARKIAETEFSMQVCMQRYLIAMATIKPATKSAPRVKLPLKDRAYSSALAFARNLRVTLRKK